MAADSREQILLDGFAVTGVTSASQQSIVTGGFTARALIYALMAFAAATRRFLFEKARR